MKLIPYSAIYKKEWDSFVDTAKNATLLHHRDYMDYHADRFPDASLIVMQGAEPFALLPATFNGTILSSHAGLTYGGLLLNKRATAAEVLKAMHLILNHVRSLGARQFIYKPVPHIYHRLPAEEDLYALFRLNARIIGRNISAVIDTSHPIKLRDDRKAGIRKAIKDGIIVETSTQFPRFWEILTDNLMTRHNAVPVHSLAEIIHLSQLFPDNIHLHIARKDDTILGGAVVYISPTVAHTQYISTTPEGRQLHVLDLLLHTLFTTVYSSYRYFDFGTSNGDNGHYLNENLISQKEGFGSRGIVYDTYSIPL